ncbi:glycosyl hydrolase family 28-related protein [Paraburkholderia strydomiana]|uniref:glycosyl hydrolase family 28-related protein n=1 Tax=Paraburkholderia strydomiana TaxID=1245417 RepID=UPI0028566A0E|nr:glycosyl hydrolase family 28-related protein [Paraburkholderia strydomiana]MDR7006093.1 hypothetical protein [Paraburkholderia strydomiana]
MQIIPNAKSQFIDQNGLPLASGTVGFYYPGTLNPKPTYQDAAGTIANTNPVTLDSRGQALIWGSGVYRQIVKDASGVTIWDQVTEDSNSGLIGNITDAKFVSGTDFTPGVTSSLTLPLAPGAIANTWIYFDAAYQADDQVLSLVGTALTFKSPIPVGVQEVNIKIGTTIAIGTPNDGSVADSSVAAGSALYNRINHFIDVTDPRFGAKCDGVTDDAAAIRAATAYASSKGGGVVFIPAGTTLVASSIVVPPNVTIRGDSMYATTVTVPANATGFNGYNPNAVFILNSNNCGIRDLGMDGNIANNASQGFGAISNTVLASGVFVESCYIRNFIYNGIVFNPATGSISNFRINRNRLENIGWGAITAYCSINGQINQNSIISCGSAGIQTGYNASTSNFTFSQYIIIEGNYVNRSIPPTHIVSNAAESGFMIGVGAGDEYITISNNICYDNRNAKQDGIGLGQDGTRVNEGLVFDSNVVIYAGLFGIDVSSNHIVSNNYIRYAAQQGIKLGTDIGGNLVNATVVDNIVDSCNLSGVGSADGIWVDGTLTSSIPTALYENIKINGNRVTDFNSPANTVYGLNIGFRNGLTYLNCEFSGNDFSQLAGVNGNAFHVSGPGTNYVGWTYRRNKHPQVFPAIAGTGPLIMGLDAATIVNGSATNVTDLVGGFDGQEIMVQSGSANTTYINGLGISIHNSVNQAAAANSYYKFFRYSSIWYLNQFFTP